MPEPWRNRLRDAIERSGRKHSDVSRAARINPATLSRVLNGHLQPSFETVTRIAHAVNENVGWLLEERGFTISEEEQREVRKALRILEDVVAQTSIVRVSPNAIQVASIDVPHAFITRGARLVYQALDDSMRGVSITKGDIVYVKPTRDLDDAAGRIVVCRFDGAEYVKILDIRGGRMFLLSRNDRHPPIDIDERRFELIGIVVGRSGAVS